MSTDPLDYPFWLASRSAGVVAYLLLSAAVVLGLATTTRLARVRGLHERIALLALGAVAAHGLFLLPDGWLHPSLTAGAGPVHARLPAAVDRARGSSPPTARPGSR